MERGVSADHAEEEERDWGLARETETGRARGTEHNRDTEKLSSFLL